MVKNQMKLRYIYGLDHILFCTSSYICVAIFAFLGCFVAWLAVCNIPEELKTSSMPQQKPKILQHLFFSAASVLYISVHMKYVSIHPCSAVVTISPTEFPFCCSARWRNTNEVPFHLTTMMLLTTMSCIPNKRTLIQRQKNETGWNQNLQAPQ